MESNYFPFPKYISYDLSLEKINHVPEKITKKEMMFVENFLTVFHNFTMEERRLILQLDRCDIFETKAFSDRKYNKK